MTRARHAAVLGALAALLATASGAPGQSPSPSPGGRESPAAVAEGLEAAWRSRDLEGYLGSWEFETPAERQEEQYFASAHFASEETQLVLQRVAESREDGGAQVSVRIFSVTEPRARVEQWTFRLRRRERGWAIVARESNGSIDGLVHLSLSPEGFRAAGLVLRLEDFELQMTQGTLFTSPPGLGPTVMVFAGEGTVRFHPRPETEQRQLAIFSGGRDMVEKVRTAFVRIHPADLRRVLGEVRLEPDPRGPQRLEEAQRFYRDQVSRSFILDVDLPRSPWWVLPAPGDASVSFRTAHLRTLTYTVNASDPEGISLFDRARRRQICLYPQQGHDPRYNEDEGRAVDVLSHELRVRFDPFRPALAAEDTLHLQLLSAAATLRLKLAEDLRVESITSPEGGNHLFFRVRDQDSVMVSLGALSGRVGEATLTVRYAGVHAPAPIEQEALQAEGQRDVRVPFVDQETVLIERVLVYTNRTAWYPQAGPDDYATARLRFDVPVGFTAVSGGERTSARVEGARTIVEYRQDRPGKYISVAVGRLMEAGSREEGPIPVRAFALGRTRRAAQELLETSADILRFYTGEFGPCPFPSINLVVIEGVTPGGHSPPGMVVVQQRPAFLRGALREDPVNFSDVPGFFLAHELAHQWWGHGVAGQNYHERWLSEAVAQYAAALWVRHARGEVAFASMLRRMGSWAFRMTDQGPISLGYRLGHIKGDPQAYRAVVYDKGAYVLHMLRAIVGEDAFRRGLIAFQDGHRYAKAGTEDLREALESAAELDLGPYFQQWVYGTALPSLSLSHRQQREGPGYRTVVVVKARDLPGPVPLEVTVRHEGGVARQVVLLPAEGGSFIIDTPRAPKKVEINADRTLLTAVTGG